MKAVLLGKEILLFDVRSIKNVQDVYLDCLCLDDEYKIQNNLMRVIFLYPKLQLLLCGDDSGCSQPILTLGKKKLYSRA